MGTDEDLARPRPVGRPDHALPLHLFHHPGGTVVADVQFALYPRRRTLPVLDHEVNGLVVELVVEVLTVLAFPFGARRFSGLGGKWSKPSNDSTLSQESSVRPSTWWR